MVDELFVDEEDLSVAARPHGARNDGSQRLHEQHERSHYRAVMARDSAHLYTWLLDHQARFWRDRGLE
jgi:hypothetical protein